MADEAVATVTDTADSRALARWALRDNRTLSKAAKLVWLMLDTRGLDPHPSKATLAADCRMTEATLSKALRELVVSGWLVIIERRAREGDSDTNQYRLVCPRQPGVGSKNDPTVGVKIDPTVGVKIDPRSTTRSPTVRKTYSPTGVGDPHWAEAQQFYDADDADGLCGLYLVDDHNAVMAVEAMIGRGEPLLYVVNYVQKLARQDSYVNPETDGPAVGTRLGHVTDADRRHEEDA
jgi:hypothetical protein